MYMEKIVLDIGIKSIKTFVEYILSIHILTKMKIISFRWLVCTRIGQDANNSTENIL